MVLQSPTYQPASLVRVYADDTKQQLNVRGERWMYLGLVAIAHDRHGEALDLLLQDRDAAGYQGEVHFSECSDYRMAALARRWLDRVLWDDPKDLFRFHVLGIRMDHLHRRSFGDGGSKNERRIYARFFRSALSYALQSLFPSPVAVQAVVHDGGDLEKDDLFDWHAIWRLGRDVEGVDFDCERVVFVNSDHQKEGAHPTESHFVQLTDLVLGAVRQALDATSAAEHKIALGRQVLPLVQRLTSPRLARNRNSRYRYVGRCSLSFFPKLKLTVAQLRNPYERLRPSFFSGRESLLANNDQQGVLPFQRPCSGSSPIAGSRATIRSSSFRHALAGPS
jgi:hypothetical protein